MEKHKENLKTDAAQLTAYARNTHYLSLAFYHIFGKKLLEEGYVDCSNVLKALGKGTYYSRLSSQGSSLYKLFAKSCMTSENIEIMLDYLEAIAGSLTRSLTPLEEESLVYWIFLPYTSTSTSKREKKREYLTAVLESLVPDWAEESGGENAISVTKGINLQEKDNIIYDADRCELEVIDSVSRYVKDISLIKQQDAASSLYFRGHSRLSYALLPSIKRSPGWLENENRMYQELIIRCASDFAQCQSHLEYLVEMQHYGLPTRLLDITENPLVALYFACCSNPEDVGEVIVLQTRAASMKYAKSDTAAILAALPVFDSPFRTKLYELCINGLSEEEDTEYMLLSSKLAGEVKSRNPGFEPRIRKKDLLSHVFIMPLRNNRRIIKQDGSFILCGLGNGKGEGNSLRSLRYRDKSGKKQIFIVGNKENLLQELDQFSVNKAALFPEIDDVAEYLKQKYSFADN